MTATVELLSRLFKPVQVLLVDTNEELEHTLSRVCACDLERDHGAPLAKIYDAVFVDSGVSPDTLERLKDCGPLIIVGTCFGPQDCPVVLLPKMTEHALERVFECLKIKMRTADVVDAITALAERSASDAPYSVSHCATQARLGDGTRP